MKKITSREELIKIQMDILNYLDRVCKEHKITYMLSGGTLLGAIRHQGFIPWDDDIDVMLLRKDYEKLIKILCSYRGKYKVLHPAQKGDYYYPFAKLIDQTTGTAQNVKIPISENGVGIDIFPIDDLPLSDRYLEFKMKSIKKIRNLFDDLCFTTENGRHGILIKIRCKILSRMLKGISLLINLIAITGNSTRSERVAVLVWGYDKREIVSRKTMDKVVPVLFESKKYPAPKGYDIYLSSLYKDYMKLPPKSKQHSEHRAESWHKNK